MPINLNTFQIKKFHQQISESIVLNSKLIVIQRSGTRLLIRLFIHCYRLYPAWFILYNNRRHHTGVSWCARLRIIFTCIRRKIGWFGFQSHFRIHCPSVPGKMIVFSGPTVPSRTALQWSRLGNPSQESLWIVDQPQRTVKPFDLAKQKQVNLSDLANVTIDVLCRLQLLYSSNNTSDEWVNISFLLFQIIVCHSIFRGCIKGLGVVWRQH